MEISTLYQSAEIESTDLDDLRMYTAIPREPLRKLHKVSHSKAVLKKSKWDYKQCSSILQECKNTKEWMRKRGTKHKTNNKMADLNPNILQNLM